MRGPALALAIFAALAAPAVSQTKDGPSRSFRPSDLFALQAAADPQVRPDGGAVAYVRVTADVMTDGVRRSIWLVDPRSGVQTPLLADERQNASPRWSPDGQRLAFVAGGAGGPPQLYVRWMESGQTARVATLTESPNAIAWSPDGRSIALVMLVPDEGQALGAPLDRPEGARWADPLKIYGRLNYRADGRGYLKPGYAQLFVVSADGGAPRQLTFGAFDVGDDLAWDRDGAAILIASNRQQDWERDPRESEIYRVSLADGALTALTHRVGPDSSPAVSPDGLRIAYLGYDDQRRRGYENVRLYVMDADGAHAHVLTDGLDRSVRDPVWARDGRSVYVAYVDRGVTKVARVGLDGKVQAVAEGLAGDELDRPYSGGAYSVGGGGLVAFTAGDASRPPDIAVTRGGSPARVTDLNRDLLAARTFARTAPLAVTSAYDRKPIDAWIVTPSDFDPSKKYPLILEIHGGPFDSYGPVFSTDDQLYAAAGYIVVYANPRGSTSYGEAFANEIDKNYPSHDYDDLMSVVDAAVAKGFVDESRLYVTGGSGGGLLTAWIVGKTRRFKAAAVQKPVINWTSEVLTVDVYGFMARYWFGKMPWEDPAGYWARSPLSLVGEVATPTLVVVGEQDMRTPDSEAEQYYQALQLRGVPTALVKVPGASHHGLAARPSQAAAKAGAILAWFDRYR